MIWLSDVFGKRVRLTNERKQHLEIDHPEMRNQLRKIKTTLKNPDLVIESSADSEVSLFYKHFVKSPVTDKFLCAVVKTTDDDRFILTSYFTNRMKKGNVLWKKK